MTWTGFLQLMKGSRGLRAAACAALIALAILMLTGRVSGAGPSDSTALERRLERILSGVCPGLRVRVMVAEDPSGQPEGAVVAVEGLDDVGVALELQRAVTTLLGVEAERVGIVGGGFGL